MDTKAPKRDFCLRLLAEQGVTDDVRNHSLLVNAVATFLGKKLVENQELIDLQLLDRSSLLHDVCKGKDNHAMQGARLLSELGYPAVAEVISHHTWDFILEQKFSGWEDLLVYYADKRVMGTSVVSLDDRFNVWIEKFPDLRADLEIVREKSHQMEAQLFEHLSFLPDELKEKVPKPF